MKPRILFCGEASYLNTGYGTYVNEVLSRLHKTNLFDIAEFAVYGEDDDPRIKKPWKTYGTMPRRGNKQEEELYKSNTHNQFGLWKWHDVCFDFMPHHIFDFRDFWMMYYEVNTPIRNCYTVTWMPTVDAAPQHPEWVDTYLKADYLFTYTDWAQNVLKEQMGDRGKSKLCGIAPPGADLLTFKPVSNKQQQKSAMGLPADSFIIGTVMRNQRRKLYPELIDAFIDFLSVAPADLANKSFLYLHTGFPDLGWNIPEYIRDKGVGNKVLFTYKCRNKGCDASFPAFFTDARMYCPACGQQSSYLVGVKDGVSRNILSNIYNCFDVYVQYSNSEGIGMPQAEAAACGVPVFATYYSGMSDVVEKTGGFPINVKHFAYEAESGCKRAIPDSEDFVKKLLKFANMHQADKDQKRLAARQGAEKHFNFEVTAKILADHFRKLPLKNEWGAPPKTFQPNMNPPENLSNENFVRWCCYNVLGDPDKMNSYSTLRMIKDLNYGFTCLGGNYNEFSNHDMIQQNTRNFSQSDLFNQFVQMRHDWNGIEHRRYLSCKGRV